ncbi:MAG: hypothetical protein FWF86_08915 [Clostridia bacterium]|nr:hypothetical protein [Clostridia bacterium]
MQMKAFKKQQPEISQRPNEDTVKSDGRLRRTAGKALGVFMALMVVLTLANQAMNELAIAQVDAVNPQRGALERRIDASGQLQSADLLPIYAEAPVHVEQVYVRSGQEVAAGEPLFTLEAAGLREWAEEREKAFDEAAQNLADAQQAYAYAKADMRTNALDRYAKAQEKVDQAQADYDAALEQGASQRRVSSRLDDLEKAIRSRDGIGNVRNYFEKERELERAKRDHEDALANWEDTVRIEKNATVFAPVEAQVASLDIKAGDTASTSTAAVKLAPIEVELELVVVVNEEEAENLETGDEARISIGNSDYLRPILAIAPSAQEAGKVELSFRLAAGAGRIGMSADVQIRKRTQNYDLLVPLSALRKDNAGYYVYTIVQQEGALGAQTTVERADLSLLEQDSTRAAVQGSVNMRDRIVSRGDRELHDGDRVRVRED